MRPRGAEISRREGWDGNLNKHNVIRLDMTEIMQSRGPADAPSEVARLVLPELREIAPGAGERDAGHPNELASALWDVVQATGRKFDEATFPQSSFGVAISGEVPTKSRLTRRFSLQIAFDEGASRQSRFDEPRQTK